MAKSYVLDAKPKVTCNGSMPHNMKWAIIALVIGGILYYKQGMKTRVARANTPVFQELIGSQSCAGKKACVLVYVAPWCPACISLSPLFQQLKAKMESDPEYGMKIIVGQERNPGDNERMASRYGLDSLIDIDNKFHSLLEIDRYPTVLMVERSGLVSKKNQDVIVWATPRYQLHP